MLPLLVRIGFRIYFTPLTGVLFAFPSRYWFTIGQSGVFSLGGWSPHVQSKFHVLRPTCCKLSSSKCFRVQGYHLVSLAFPDHSLTKNNDCWLVPVRSPLLRESRLDPAAGSPTATLLRLHPSHESHRGNRSPEG